MNSNNKMTKVRTIDLAQETEDTKLIDTNVYVCIFEKYENL